MMMGKLWSKDQMEQAIQWGPHKLALSDNVIVHFAEEVTEKVQLVQARIIEWDWIWHDPPPKLKISPIAADPHKSKLFQSILDLSFSLRLTHPIRKDQDVQAFCN